VFLVSPEYWPIVKADQISRFTPYYNMPGRVTTCEPHNMARDLCSKVANDSPCEFGDKCRFTHDIHAYLQAKPPDVPTASCPVFNEFGECKQVTLLSFPSSLILLSRYGFKCRFLGTHLRSDLSQSPPVFTLLKDPLKIANSLLSFKEINYISSDILKQLRCKKVIPCLSYLIDGWNYSSTPSPSLMPTLHLLMLFQSNLMARSSSKNQNSPAILQIPK